MDIFTTNRSLHYKRTVVSARRYLLTPLNLSYRVNKAKKEKGAPSAFSSAKRGKEWAARESSKRREG